jgi:hypothetical protein
LEYVRYIHHPPEHPSSLTPSQQPNDG